MNRLRKIASQAGWGFVFLVALGLPKVAWTAIHPVPLDAKVDSAKCLECHNSDDNREFGGAGPNGPHGSGFWHILERRYEFSQSATPGGTITNLFPNPDLGIAGPYALCGKCHDLSKVTSNTSFPEHSEHIVSVGASCSVCHTAHGMGATSGTITGERLVNFDANVVAPNGTTPISYNHATQSCVLVCHGDTHSGAAPGAKTHGLSGH